MTVNTTARAEARRLIMESAAWLAGEGGKPRFTRSELVAAMARGVSPRVLAYELDALRIAGDLRVVREGAGARATLYALPATADTPDETAAPDWKPGFPSDGRQIGPAWAAMWAELADGDWHDVADLAVIGAEAGGCLPGTARNLLFPAVKAGLILPDSRYDETAKRWRTWYCRPVAAAVPA